FIPKLKQHLLPRIQRLLAPHLWTQHADPHELSGNWTGVALHNDRIFTHQLMQISYTTYDVRREYDVVRLKAGPDVMITEDPSGWDADNSTGAPPYRYARIMGIFHTDVRF
ncbi:hypothetical protein BKA70DRAFT_1084477, partial [Coprinopsis sp. MPI-PUGE-AT-0042]